MMRTLLPFAVVLLPGCEREAACERAVKVALGNPESYRTIDTKEVGETGKALELYEIHFAYGNDNIVNGMMMCSYDNNDKQASTYNLTSPTSHESLDSPPS